ncbi:Endoglucanase E1 [Lachnellula willkommii]|uniref:Endoglucanase E1 n=1 Tax=Lachnellula willkommii TaxID=215461 RepID=A0A559MG63_9HELO|nr:Endoglucanase E1 [Lachnellula willkommii]
MPFSHLLSPLVVLLVLTGSGLCAWPNGPFSTSGRWILDGSGGNVTYAGANWPGAADTMIPEGLQYASIENIVTKIKSLGMNVIRLTYAIEMIDDIYESGSDTLLKTSFVNALGESSGTTVYNAVLQQNPQFDNGTTRLEVFDAIAAECYKQQVWVHLDNHVSKAQWCCSETDGNAWFGDTYFNISNWQRGLQYMATHGGSWGNLMSMSLRNEPRSPSDNSTLVSESYNWGDWYTNVVTASGLINQANPDVLIFFSGLSYDTYITPIPTGASLGDNRTFNKSSFTYEDKIVLELHNYATSATSCSDLESTLYTDGFSSLNSSDPSVVNVLPMVMTEWGYSQDNTTYQGVYASCLQNYLPSLHAGWMIWVIAGSYYIRSGTQDFDETWGLLNHDWSGWRSSAAIENNIVPMVQATLG